MQLLERAFRLREAGTTVRREVTAGIVTFATLSYILFVQPAVLANPACGMDPRGVLFATCVGSAAACFLMAWWANYPIALAPAMGHNFFFVFGVCLARGMPWQQALAADFLAGALFLLLAGSRLRERVMNAVPAPLVHAIAAGIGLLLALLGLEWGGLVVAHPATYVQLGELSAPVALLSLFGLALGSALLARGVRAALLITIVATAAAGWAASALWRIAPPLVGSSGVVGAPPSPSGTAFRLDFAGLFARPLPDTLAVLLVFFLLALFDSVGTLIGVGARAGLLVDGKLPRAQGALAADAAGTVIGTTLGTSTITAYVESAAGIAAGGRTGLTTAVVGVCMLLALVFTPALESVGAGVVVGEGAAAVVRHPVLAPVLILVGVLMAGALARIDWADLPVAIPAFLTIVVMQLSVSITDGIAWGFIATSLCALAARRARTTPLLVHALALVFLLRYLLLR